MSQSLEIGLDFHGVIVNVCPIKQYLLWLITGQRNVPASLLKRELAVKAGIATEAQYLRMSEAIYEDTSFFLTAEPMPKSIITMERLLDLGHRLRIISSVGDPAAETAKTWSTHYGVPSKIRFVPVGRDSSKADAAKKANLDVFVDNEMARLRELKGVVPHLILMSRPHNTKERTQGIAKRVRDWNDLYRYIQKIAREKQLKNAA